MRRGIVITMVAVDREGTDANSFRLHIPLYVLNDALRSVWFSTSNLHADPSGGILRHVFPRLEINRISASTAAAVPLIIVQADSVRHRVVSEPHGREAGVWVKARANRVR